MIVVYLCEVFINFQLESDAGEDHHLSFQYSLGSTINHQQIISSGHLFIQQQILGMKINALNNLMCLSS